MIEFIYFDVGGVLLFDFSGTNKYDQMLNDLDLDELQKNKFMELWKELEKKVCIGLDADSLLPELSEKLGVKFPSNYSLLLDFVNRFEPNPVMSEFVLKLNGRYKTGLLTSQYPRMLQIVREKGLIVDYPWDVIVDSSIIGMSKPNRDIYGYAQIQSHTDPEKILFIDNSAKNLVVPEEMGWKTFLYDNLDPERSTQELSEFIFSQE